MEAVKELNGVAIPVINTNLQLIKLYYIQSASQRAIENYKSSINNKQVTNHLSQTLELVHTVSDKEYTGNFYKNNN
jgi:hypothetical protein